VLTQLRNSEAEILYRAAADPHIYDEGRLLFRAI